MAIIPVILSGGAGTRLWPLSRNEHPKQFLPLISDKTMLQETLLRLKGLKTEPPIICCAAEHRFLVARQLNEMGGKNPTILLEPLPKNTAPAVAACCYAAIRRDPDAVVLVLPSDHIITDLAVFHSAVMTAVKHAEKGSLVIFGIEPTYPSTAYGYVKLGQTESDGAHIFEKFIEKPCLEKACKYLKSGLYVWNSGMFVFKASAFIDELKTYCFETAELAEKAYITADVDTDFVHLNKESFGRIKSDSIDYAVMEKTTKGKIIKLNAGWNDVGSWSALYDIGKKNENNNVIKGDIISFDTLNSYIYGGKRKIVTIGLDNFVVVDCDDALLIARMDKVQYVKTAAESIKNTGGENKPDCMN